MTQPAETALMLAHSTAYFRVWNGQPEMLLQHGCDAGAAYIVGRAELEAVAEQLRLLLQHNAGAMRLDAAGGQSV